MHSRSLGSRQFYGDIRAAAVSQGCLVISGPVCFIIVAEDDFLLIPMDNRQQCDVAQVADARAAQVLVAEADEHTVAVMVARTPVPAACRLSRSQLHVAKRHIGAKKDMSMPTGADAWVHIKRGGVVTCQYSQYCTQSDEDRK